MFDVLDYPGTLTRIAVTPGYTDSGGDWVPESTSISTLSGHVSDVTYEELRFLPLGIVEKGVQKLSTSNTLNVGDRVQIDDVEYTVYTKLHSNNIIEKHIGVLRSTYILQKI
jgi:hypothetical protein